MHNHGLSEEQVATFRTEGYLVLESFFDAEMLARIDRTIDAIASKAIESGEIRGILEFEPESAGATPVVRRIFDPFDQHEEFRAIATDERLLDCIESLIGPNFSLQHSKLNMKAARVGSVVEWHQDLAYFPHTNDDLISLLIYLDDASEENGCLQVLPRHHMHYFDHTLPDGEFAGMITEDMSNDRFGKPVPLAAPAGSVIFMHCITPHSSLPNRSSKARRTLIFEYRASDSFPIYFGALTMHNEPVLRQLRGKPARRARFGGPPPIIPDMGDHDHYRSLYEMQSDAKSQNRESK
jgi:ectoine hydroxylase-related dioxygenase (phytanoyl-CoA dioxygenase family)